MDTPKTKLKTEKLRRSTLSQFFSFQFVFKVYNLKSTSQQCKICAPTDQQKFPNWGRFVGEAEC